MVTFKTVNLEIPEDLHTQIKMYAAKHKITMGATMAICIKESMQIRELDTAKITTDNLQYHRDLYWNLCKKCDDELEKRQ